MKPLLRAIAAGACAGSLLGVVVGAPVAAAGASRLAPQPLPVQSASLVQDGQSIVWQVQLAVPFSPSALTRSGRALCLLIEGDHDGVVTGELCVAGPAKGSSQPRLLYTKVIGNRAGPARSVLATVTRGGDRELTASFLPSRVGLAYSPLHWQVVSSLRGAACAPPPGPHQSACFVLFPITPGLLKLHVPVLVGCSAGGASLVSHGPTRAREIALTFDDGPWSDPPTLEFLRVLEREHVPATFFEIGRQIGAFDPSGAIERRMLSDGDMIGDHTWSHPSMPGLAPSAQRLQLVETMAAISRATRGFTPCLWRPPYGAVTPSVVRLARSLGLLTIMWNVDPRDWATPGVGAIYSGVVGHATSGAIVIQHFGGGPRYQTLAALPREIATLRSRGYRFVTVDQMLGLKLRYR